MKRMLLIILFCALLSGCKSQDSLMEEREEVKSNVILKVETETNVETETDEKTVKDVEIETKNRERSLSLKLNKDEEERKELCRPRVAKYEMNIILEMLEIQRWLAPPYAFDERDLPTDEALGSYSKERLETYLEDQRELEVEILYFFGSHLPERSEEKFPLQIIKIYEQGKPIRFGYVFWSWWGDLVMTRDYYKLDELEIEMEEWDNASEARVKKKSSESVIYKKADYKGDTVLGLDNIEEVIKRFVTIREETEWKKLIKLPLTQRFYNQCVEDYPYAVNSEEMRLFWFEFYGLGDDNKIICLYTLSPYTDDMSRLDDEHYVYSIEMQMQDGQIESMDMTLLRHYLPE